MKNCRVTIFIILAFSPSLLFAQKKDITAKDTIVVIRTIDSLNNAAFNRKAINPTEALSILAEAKELALKNEYPKAFSSIYYTEAGIYQQNGFSKRASAIYHLALENSRKYNDSFNINRVNIQIASSLAAEGKNEEALRLYNSCLQESLTKGPAKEVANIKNSIGLISLKQNDYKKAETFFREALEVSLKEKFVYGQKKSFYNLGLLARAKKDTAVARSFFYNSLTLDQLISDHYGMALNQIQMSEMLIEQLKINEGISVAKEGYANAQKAGAFSQMVKLATIIRDQYQNKKDVFNIIAWQDSMINTLKLQNENQSQYDNNFIALVKDKEAQQLSAVSEIEKANKRVNDQLFVIVIGTLLLMGLALMVVISFVSYRRQKYLSQRLSKQNAVIEENAASLDKLNKEINSKNQMLEEDNRTKDKLLSIISHDLRNPITNTQTILSLINKGALSVEESRVLLGQLETQYINTTGLLDNLLGWLKSQITGKELEKKEINVYELMNGMHLEQKIALMNKRIRFINQASSETTILAEREMVKIIFRNLITNAIKFTPVDGRIEVFTRNDEQYNYVIIKDSGIGMSEEILAKVNAQKYFTRAGTSQEKGSGFGLILCRDLLQKQGGSLLIESVKGEGSVFTVQLPH